MDAEKGQKDQRNIVLTGDGHKKTAWQKVKEQLLKPRRLSRREIMRRQKLREQKMLAKHQLLKNYLLKAGMESDPKVLSNWVFRICVSVNIIIAGYLIYSFSNLFKLGFLYILTLTLTVWAAVFIFTLFLFWLALYIVIDLLIYKRRVGLEEVLPDFLLLASANIRAGMPIDKALWYAVRPRFGVLAKEMEMVAKATMSGQDFETALYDFYKRYDSVVLKNTVNLLVESINAGGEIGALLNKISANIQTNNQMKKEIAAGISSYAIFITVAAIIIAPILFAISSQLLLAITSLLESVSVPAGIKSPLFFVGGKMGAGVKSQDFLIFAVVNLFLTALFSAMIVTIIKKGEIKAGVRYIPIYIGTSLIIFFLARIVFGNVFGSLF